MISSGVEAVAVAAWFDEDNLWVRLADGRQLAVPLAYFPRLLGASEERRSKVLLLGGGRGLHWEEIDEDISVRGLLLGFGDRSRGTAAAGK
jgi:uncharacterized protein DUF2442